jgi:hypothetical protein
MIEHSANPEDEDVMKAETPTGDLPDAPAYADTPEEENTDPVLEDGKIKINKDGKMIEILIPDYTIRGQLGSVITKELNELFKEGNNLKDVEGIRIQVNNPENNLVHESYICLTDISKLNKTHSRELLDQLVPATESYKNVLCYIDLDTYPKGPIDLAIETLKNMNVQFFYKKDHLLEFLSNIGTQE